MGGDAGLAQCPRLRIEDPEAYLDAMERLDMAQGRIPTENADIAALSEEPYALFGLTQFVAGALGGTAQTANEPPVAMSMFSLVPLDEPLPLRRPESILTNFDAALEDGIGLDEIIHWLLESGPTNPVFGDTIIVIDDDEADQDSDNALDLWVTSESGSQQVRQVEATDDADMDSARRLFDTISESTPKRRRLRTKAPIPAPLPMPSQRLSDAAKSRGVSPAAFKRMVLCGLPMVMLNALVWIQAMVPIAQCERTACTELFAGIGIVAESWEDHLYPASRFDNLNDEIYESMTTPEGFITAMQMLRNNRPKGMSTIATVCSS